MRLQVSGVRFVTVSAILGLLYGLAGSVAQGQPAPMRWGDIPDEHVSMTVYAADSSAAAVILGEFSSVEIDADLVMMQEVHRRVKLFSEAAYDLATVELVYYHPGRTQRVQRIDGQTFVSDGAGGLRRVNLNRRDIHEEEDGDFTRVRFTLPALEPGAIFEYRYRIRTEPATTIPEWVFQDEVPTLWSEYRASVPAFITINRHPGGQPHFHIQEIDERPFTRDDIDVQTALRRERSGGWSRDEARTRQVVTGVRVRANTYRWVMTDVPALKPEAYVASIWNHAYAMRFQVSGYYDHRMVFRPLSDSWADVAERLRENGHFGRRLRAPRAVRERALELTADASSDAEKLHRIYDFVRQSIVWNDRYRLFAARPLDRVMESRSGSSGEINLLLIAMLREAGIEANPVVLSTRRNGRAIGWFTTTRQFNHVVALAQVDQEEVFLDATDPHRPAGMLPLEALNVEGWLLTDNQFGWVPIDPPSGTMTAVGLTASLDASGALRGDLEARLSGYTAYQARLDIARVDDAGERAAALSGSRAYRHSGVAIEGLDGDGPIDVRSRFESDEYGRPMAHLLTFNPVVLSRLESNPFTQPERTYPIDFTYPHRRSFTAEIQLPEGYVVEELPQSVQLALPRNGAAYQRMLTAVDGGLRVQRTFMLRQTVFEPEEYVTVREFFERVAAADAEMVVLVRDDGAATTGDEAVDAGGE